MNKYRFKPNDEKSRSVLRSEMYNPKYASINHSPSKNSDMNNAKTPQSTVTCVDQDPRPRHNS